MSTLLQRLPKNPVACFRSKNGLRRYPMIDVLEQGLVIMPYICFEYYEMNFFDSLSGNLTISGVTKSQG